MVDFVLIVVLIEFVLLLAFPIASLAIKPLRKPIIMVGILALILGEAVYIFGEINWIVFNFQETLRFTLIPLGYLLLLFGFRNILKEEKK